ncbi:thermonuclease family protein [Palleronia aestuarii]|uniref:thermonuclease family protein n=1 Tax=Palleronia aestuarii TaxID=568105 RepID=UPI001474C897|nr:thermonuclease family protein [Palleronia aestuarii]
MKRPIALACLCLMVSCGPEGERVDPASIRVIDGDTIKLSGERLRLIGYDTPEASEPRCMGEKRKARIATRRLEDLLASGEVVRLARTGERDRYDRGLARLFIGASDVAELMVNEGLARTYNGGRRRAWC